LEPCRKGIRLLICHPAFTLSTNALCSLLSHGLVDELVQWGKLLKVCCGGAAALLPQLLLGQTLLALGL
jgi:hypothetical protein